MPAQAKSLEITERYRSNMIRLRRQGQREAGRMWRQVRPDDLDGTFPLGQLELTVSTLQREAARLSSAYLATFIASELGEPERPPALSVWDKTFNGNDLREGLRSAIITAKLAIKDGTDPREATKASRKILVSDVGLFIDTAARESLRQGMEMDDRIVGYQRAVKGTCAACAGDTQYEAFSENAPVVPLNVHPHCQCVAEPQVIQTQTKTEQRLNDHQRVLTGNARDAVSQYQGSESEAFAINKVLRGETPMTERISRLIQGMDNAMQRSGSLGTPIHVYRGIRKTLSDFGFPAERLSFTDKGFSSVSTSRQFAEQVAFARATAKQTMVWELDVDPRVRGIWVNKVIGHPFRPEERELILEHGCRYVVTGTRMVRDPVGRWSFVEVRAKVLPPK